MPKPFCNLSYITIVDAIDGICKFNPGMLLAKLDIKNAFHLLHVHPTDRHLLAMLWHDLVYMDTCLPFGLRSANKLFNPLAQILILDQ